MRSLRKMVRKLILESRNNTDKIIELMLKDGSSLKQAVVLAESIGLIQPLDGKPMTIDLRHEVMAVFVCDATFAQEIKEAYGYGFSGVINPVSDTEVQISFSVPNQARFVYSRR